jgi:hypothetical protein
MDVYSNKMLAEHTAYDGKTIKTSMTTEQFAAKRRELRVSLSIPEVMPAGDLCQRPKGGDMYRIRIEPGFSALRGWR